VRRTLLALAVAGAALATVPPAEAAPLRFERRCTGQVDSLCYYQFCGFASCTTTDCVVFYDPFEGYNTGTCLGVTRPDKPVES
jgi:hypothetical protein